MSGSIASSPRCLDIFVGTALKFGICLIAPVLLVSGCSFVGFGGSTPPPIYDLGVPASVGEVTWEWETDAESLNVLPVVGGVAVFDGSGVTVLSGDTGQVRWEYHQGEGRVIGAVTSNGEHVVVQEPVPGAPQDFRMHVLDVATGESLREEALDVTERKVGDGGRFHAWIAPSLADVSVDHELWFSREGSEVIARRFDDGGRAWATSEVRACEGVGDVGPIALVDEVLLGSVTCYAFDEDDPDDDALHDSNADFTSEVVAWNAADGRELWRLETPEVTSPYHSRNRSLTDHSGGIVSADASPTLMSHWVDPTTEEYGWVEDANVVGSFEGGERLGVWRIGEYRVEDRSGEVLYRVSEPSEQGRVAPLALADGMVRVLESSEGVVFARFRGADREVDLSLEVESGVNLEFGVGAVVPGAVVVPFTDNEGRSGVVGMS
ncbi:PQQ-binding-like beta-propeller repeat protein [Nocardiopsis alba]|uniref:outer membrane protein assembly factor BamB family protein n=2 Tax=Nocardiopsis alba TaxID=53437 RepID=UPI00340DC558